MILKVGEFEYNITDLNERYDKQLDTFILFFGLYSSKNIDKIFEELISNNLCFYTEKNELIYKTNEYKYILGIEKHFEDNFIRVDLCKKNIQNKMLKSLLQDLLEEIKEIKNGKY